MRARIQLTFRMPAALATLTAVMLWFPPEPALTSLQQMKEGVSVGIEEIRYAGRDTYLVTIAVVNGSSNDIQMRMMENHFYIQTEKGWDRLRTGGTPEPSFDAGVFQLAAAAQRTITVSLIIPLDTPGLFRTYEGDISLLFRYRLSWKDRPSYEGFLKEDESYYWITPLTRKWLHREGM